MIECQLLRMRPMNERGVIEPVNPKLLKMVEDYYKAEFPSKPCPNFTHYNLTWVVLEKEGEEVKVIGVTAASYMVDIPCFHSQSPKAYLLMFRRLHQWALESGFPLISVFIQPENLERVKSMMERCMATTAERWMFNVKPEIEVK